MKIKFNKNYSYALLNNIALRIPNLIFPFVALTYSLEDIYAEFLLIFLTGNLIAPITFLGLQKRLEIEQIQNENNYISLMNIIFRINIAILILLNIIAFTINIYNEIISLLSIYIVSYNFYTCTIVHLKNQNKHFRILLSNLAFLPIFFISLLYTYKIDNLMIFSYICFYVVVFLIFFPVKSTFTAYRHKYWSYYKAQIRANNYYFVYSLRNLLSLGFDRLLLIFFGLNQDVSTLSAIYSSLSLITLIGKASYQFFSAAMIKDGSNAISISKHRSYIILLLCAIYVYFVHILLERLIGLTINPTLVGAAAVIVIIRALRDFIILDFVLIENRRGIYFDFIMSLVLIGMVSPIVLNEFGFNVYVYFISLVHSFIIFTLLKMRKVSNGK